MIPPEQRRQLGAFVRARREGMPSPEPARRRRTPGRPVTLGTTRDFLDHFGLEELRDLPGLEELKGAGLLSGRIPANFNIPSPLMSDGSRATRST